MASIRKRKTSYQARVIRKGYPPLTASFPTRKEAEDWATQQEAAIRRGAFQDNREAENTTLDTCLQRYQLEVSSQKKGFRKECSVITRWRRSSLAPRMMATLRGKDIAEYRDARLKEVSAFTVANELILLSHLCNVARKEWGMEGLQNPVALIRRPKLPRARTRRLRGDEEARLLEAAAPAVRRAIIIALETGMRQGEITGLKAEDVDLDQRVAWLRDTKNGEERCIPLSSRAMEALKDGPIGLSANYLSLCFRELCVSVGIQGLHFHDLRREAVSRLFEKGLSLPEVAAISGHKTWAMLKRYTEIQPSHLASKLD